MNSAMPVLAGVKEGWLPKFLAKQNRFGAYWVAIMVIFVIGCLPICTGMSVKQITNSTLILSGFQNALIIMAGFIFPIKFAANWKESWLHMPNSVYYVLMFISGCAQAYIIYKSVIDLNMQLAIINVCVLAAAVIYGIIRMRTTKITETDFV